jgi:hypothetical protein
MGDATFRRMPELYPQVEPVRALRSMLAQVRDFELPVGADGRARCVSRPFGTITGRDGPSAHDCVFIWPAWCRGLAYLDFEEEEYLIAGTLSGNEQRIADYRAGDCYLSLGKSLGQVPVGGGKTPARKSDGSVRRPLPWRSTTGWGRRASRAASAALSPWPATSCGGTCRGIRPSGAGPTRGLSPAGYYA